MYSTRLLINLLYLFIGLSICYISANSGLPLAKDELYYLTIGDNYFGLDLLGAAKSDSLNYMWPLALNFFGVEEYNKYYRYLGPIVYVFALWGYVGKNQLIRLIAFIFSLPVFWYFGTYLRDGFIFIFTLYLLKLADSLVLTHGALNRKKLFLFVSFIFLISTLRFYYAFPFLVMLLIILIEKWSGYKKIYVLIFMIAIFAIKSETLIYILNVLPEVSINPLDILRIFLNPLPALSFGESIDRYESAFLYNATFIFRLFNTFIIVPTLFCLLFRQRYRFKYQVHYLFLIILTMMILISGNVGPRQSFMVGLVAIVLFFKSAFWKKI